MKLLKLKYYRLRYYEHPRPSIETLKKDIRNDLISGGFVDLKGYYWVDLDLINNTCTRNAADIAIEDLMMLHPDVEKQIIGL